MAKARGLGSRLCQRIHQLSAIAIAESLIDYSNQHEPSKPKEKNENSSNGGGTRRHSPRRVHFEVPSLPKSRDDIGKQKATKDGQF